MAVRYSMNPNITELISEFLLQYFPLSQGISESTTIGINHQESEAFVQGLDEGVTYQFRLVTLIGLFTYFSDEKLITPAGTYM